ncbi:MAG: alpha/beta fold hydrolase, partial [Steroidobacteraceae bacterium]
MNAQRMRTDAALYRETSGRGAPLVLLHGWAMNRQVFDGLRAQLAPHYAVTAVDLPGHGCSPWPPDCTLARQLELLADAGPPDATLIGWSLGAQLALALAAGPLPRARRLVLIAGTARFARADGWEHGLAPTTLQRFAQSLEQDAGRTLADFIDLQVRGSAHADEVRATLSGVLDGQARARLPA